MALHGIDISHWQSGIDLSKVHCAFVIMKVTQGTGYISPSVKNQYAQAKKLGKLTGFYHYATGGSPKAEADFFLNNIKAIGGQGILALDWEQEQNARFGINDAAWIKEWCDYVKAKTGQTPIIYCGKYTKPLCDAYGLKYPYWIAEYANMNTMWGYQETPWNEGAYTCLIRQYSGTGRLEGYNSYLDLNKFYGTKNDWLKLMNATPVSPLKPVSTIAQEVIDGKWGSGEDRKNRLISAGYDYSAVQSVVNSLLKPKVHVVKKGDTWHSIAKKYGVSINHILTKNPQLLKEGTKYNI